MSVFPKIYHVQRWHNYRQTTMRYSGYGADHSTSSLCGTTAYRRVSGGLSCDGAGLFGGTGRLYRLVKMLEIVPEAGVAAFKIRNLERIGVRVLYESGTLEWLREQLLAGHPYIAFVETKELPYRDDDTSHAVVVVGSNNEIFFLNDPEYVNSPVSVSAGDFDLA